MARGLNPITLVSSETAIIGLGVLVMNLGDPLLVSCSQFYVVSDTWDVEAL